MRYLVIVDGEHYPPVVEAALKDLVAQGEDVVGTVFAGGGEKLPDGGLDAFGEIPLLKDDDPRVALLNALDEHEPDVVLDLSDEPVLHYRRRHELAAIALHAGVAYEGSDFRFTAPPRPHACSAPSIAVIGTGKRTGKTAISGLLARTLKNGGKRPVVVAMGRGGPAEPEIIRGDELELTPRDLLELADSGKHAASDYLEDALLGGVAAVGCRRCAGGLAGAVHSSNVLAGVEMANDLNPDVIVLEGSGAAQPPVHADATILALPSTLPREYLAGYMGPYRLLLSDVAIVTMCEEPFGSSSQISALVSEIQDSFRPPRGAAAEDIRVVRTVFRPLPTRSVDGATTFVATTAPEQAGASIREHLEKEHGGEVVGISHSLSDRRRLATEISQMSESADVLLCELKASGVDVATRKALEEGLEVIYMDNVPQSVDGEDLSEVLAGLGDVAARRFEDAR